MNDYPDAFLRAMRTQLGAEYEAFARALQRDAEPALRLNPLRANVRAPEVAGDPVPWERQGRYVRETFRPGADLNHFAGAYYMQDASAMAPVAALSPRPGERVLDLCAAPGGKAGQIAGRLNGSGLLIANEPDGKRAKALSGNLERLGVANAAVTSALPDALALRFPAYFDAVLVDAPCSGEGMFRRDEQARAEWTEAAPAGCAARQRPILLAAADMVRPGGRLAYSTCTFNERENEQNTRWLLDRRPDFEPMEFVLEGVGESREGMLRLWPHAVRGEGHFVALLHKKGEPAPRRHEAPRPRLDVEAERALRALTEEVLVCWPSRFGEYDFVREGDRLLAVPPGMPPLRDLRVLRQGVTLLRIGKGYIEPDHALALALRPEEARRVARLSKSEAEPFVRGEQLPFDGEKGWTLAVYDDLPLGWGKASGGALKNHIPKGVRLLRA